MSGTTRRDFLGSGAAGFGAASLGAALGWAGLPAAARAATGVADPFPVARTTSGQVQGMTFGGIARFLGIPYGAPTGGAARFLPARPPRPWSGVRPAFGFGPIAPQMPADLRSEYVRLIAWDQQNGGMGEDCLVLNVWTPALADGKRRPVFVSFHGGGFNAGSAGAPGFNGDPLARYGDAVVVTLNHRLNAFGFTWLGDLAGPRFAQSGNNGVLDLVVALRWVRDNAAAFGGDPGCVTVFGQSGGGRKVSALLSMPEAKGLFHRAIVESGSISRLPSRDEANAATRALLGALDIAPARAARLQDVPMVALLEAQERLPAAMRATAFTPMVDGATYPSFPALDASADVPVIIGTTRDESALTMTDYSLDRAGLDAWATSRFGAQAPRVVAAFRKAYPDASPFLLKVRIDTQWDRRARAIRQADARAALGGAPTWVYRFDAPAPADGGKFGAVHGTEVGLAFHDSLETLTSEVPPYMRTLNDQVANIWLAFARTGDPNNPSIPSWPRYDRAGRATLLIDRQVRVARDPDRDLRLLRDDLGSAGAPLD